jgi:hypothetical protein
MIFILAIDIQNHLLSYFLALKKLLTYLDRVESIIIWPLA